MFETATILAIASLITSVVGGVASYMQNEKAADAQEEANKDAQARDALRMKRERMETLREGRIRRAAVIAQGANQGVSSSSGVMGGAQSATSQSYQQAGFLNSYEGLTGQINKNMNKAASYGQQAALYGSVSNAAGTIFQGVDGFNTIFGQKRTTPAPVIDLRPYPTYSNVG
jgi:hypothetical protein